jgi:hypothetical protein
MGASRLLVLVLVLVLVTFVPFCWFSSVTFFPFFSPDSTSPMNLKKGGCCEP